MILSRPRLLPQERFDLEDLNALLAAGRSDARYYTGHFLASTNYVEQGFTVTGIGLKNATVFMADATAILPQGTSDFSWYVASAGEPNVVIPEAELTPNVRNYIEIQLSTQNNTPLTRAFWDPEADAGAGAEFNQIVDTITDLEAIFTVLTGGFSGSPDAIPLCIMDVDNLGNIQTILDRRPLFHRLSVPTNLENNYAWGPKVEPPYSLVMSGVVGTFVQGEVLTLNGTETATVTTGGTTSIGFNSPSGINFFPGSAVVGGTSGATGNIVSVAESFSGVDKSLKNQKNLFDALMTEIKAIKQTSYWWQDAPTTLGGLADFANSMFVQQVLGSQFFWDGNNFEIRDSSIVSPSASDILASIRILGDGSNISLSRQDGTGGSTVIPVGEKQVLYVKLPPAGTDRVYSGVGTLDTNFQVIDASAFVANDDMYWIAYRENNGIYIRGFGELDPGEDTEIDEPLSPQVLAAAIAAALASAAQDRNLKLVRGGNWEWDLTSNTLSWDANANVQVPGLSEAANSILAGSIVLPADGAIATVEVNRLGPGGALTVTANTISGITQTNNTLIIARRLGNVVIVGSHSFQLVDTEAKTLDAGLSNNSLTLIGGSTTPITEATTDIALLARGGSKRLVNTTDGILDAIARISAQVDKYFGQLELIPDTAGISQEVIVTDPDQAMLRGETRSQTLGQNILESTGARINFQTGHIFEIDGVTPLGTDFTPTIPAIGAFIWAAVGISKGSTNADNTVTGVITVTYASATGTSPSTAPKATFPTQGAGGGSITSLGQILISSADGINVDNIDFPQIVQLGVGSGGGSGGGSGDIVTLLPKARAFCYTDGSTEEFNCNPPTVISATQIQLLLDFDIASTDFAEVYYGEKFVPLFINEATTPSNQPWYRITLTNTLLINVPATPAMSLEIRTFMSTVPVVPNPSLTAGLDQKGRSIIESDGSGTPYFAEVDSSSGKTVVEVLGYTINANDVIFVNVADEYVPQYIDDNTTPGLAWQLIDGSHIGFTQDVSGTVQQIDIRVYQGSTFIDQFGNWDTKLVPALEPVILMDTASQRWILGATNDGSITAQTVSSGLANAFELARDDNHICGIQISTLGELQVNDSPTGGVLATALHLQSPNGTVFNIGITNLNELYLQDGLGNKFILRNGQDQIIKQISQSGTGTVEQTMFYPDSSQLPTPPELVTGAIPTAWAENAAINRVVQYVYTQGAWRQFALLEDVVTDKCPYGLGQSIDLILTQAQVDGLYGGGILVLQDGRDISLTKLGQTFSISNVPDARDTFARAKNNGRSDSYANPRGDVPLGSNWMDTFEDHVHNYNVFGNPGNASNICGGTSPFIGTRSTSGAASGSPSSETAPRTTIYNRFMRVN